MDVTLRDGGYSFDHQYSAETVKDIVSCLDVAGVPYIEIGHGISVGASERVSPARETDLTYAQSARSASKKAKIGMIALPALASKREIETLRPHLDFLRVGANVDALETAAPMIEFAKELGYEVFVQMIRSSRLSPERIANAAKKADQMGADVIYIVDSAGGWSPWEIGPVIKEARRATRRPLGFHGHNHLGAALANALAAVEEGCQWIDASLAGIGRGAGNVPLELFLLHMKRKGVLESIDFETIETAVNLISEELGRQGVLREDYLPASHRIDLYPWEFYVKIASTAGVEIGQFIAALEKNAKGVEIMPQDIERSLRALGADAVDVFEQLGLESTLKRKADS